MEHTTTQLEDQRNHSPKSLREALNKTPIYKKSMQRLKVNWIGQKLSPPLLLGMLEGRKEEEEKRQWEEVESKVGFYEQEEETTTTACDVREATRPMEDMDIDQVTQRMSNTFSRGDDETHHWVIIWALTHLLA